MRWTYMKLLPAAWLLAVLAGSAQGQTLLLQEVISREVSVSVGEFNSNAFQEIVSREASVFVGEEPTPPYQDLVSREYSVVVTATNAPAPVAPLIATPSPGGGTVTLSWSGYNQWAQQDVTHYLIYVSTQFFTNVSGMTALTNVPGETLSITLTGLPAGQNLYFAVVAVSAGGLFNPAVVSSGAFIIAQEVVSREMSVFVGSEPRPPYADIVSRELTVVVSLTNAPAPITQLTASNSPDGATVLLSWAAYNQWAQLDVTSYNIYYSSQAFTSIAGMTPYLTVGGETLSVLLTGLPAGQDHFFAVVPVSSGGLFNSSVNFAAAYVVAQEVVSREASVFVSTEATPPYQEVVSREMSFLVPSTNIPAPVTGVNGSLTAISSPLDYDAIFLEWTNYNEAAQQDVVKYAIYLAGSYFDTVSNMTPIATVPAGVQQDTLTGLFGYQIYYVAVVAVDALGTFNPVVRSISAQASGPNTQFNSQPQSQTVVAGTTATFAVMVTGSGAIGYQWQLNLTNLTDNGRITGSQSNVLTITNVSMADAGSYTVVVSNYAGASRSQPAILTVLKATPIITWGNLAAIQYGSALTTNQLNATANVRGTFVYNPPLGTILNAGTNLLSAQFTPDDTADYNTVNASVSLVVLPPQSADLAVTNVSAPSSAVMAQPVSLVFTITNLTLNPALPPWQNQFLLATNPAGANALSLGTATFTNSIAGGGSATVTQSLILPANVFGALYLGVTVNSSSNLLETTLTNNTAFSPSVTFVTAADLALTQLSAPPTAQFGQTVSVGFAVTNIGTATANATWNDQIYLSASANSIAGATLLATLAGTTPLAPGAGYTRHQSVTLPLSASSLPGAYYLIAVANAANTQPESSTVNNTAAQAIALSLPGLPDLAVPEVIAPGTALPGSNVTVMWTVTNQGTLNITNGAWSEAVGVSNASGALSMLADFRFTNSLNVGGFLARTQMVTLPNNTSAGNLALYVTVNNLGDIVESNTTNDTTFAANLTAIPAALSLMLPVTSVTENTSAPNLSCLVARNGDVTAPLLISLSNSATNKLAIPASVTIPAGVSTAPFTATVLNDGVPGSNVLLTLSANAGGYLGATSLVTVVNTDVPTLALSLALPQITEGQTVNATVAGLPVSNQPVVVSIVSSSTALGVPGSVTIPAYSNSVTFPVLAVQNTVIAPAQTYTISAFAGGYVGAFTNLTVLNDNAPVLTLSLDKTNINEADGPFAAMATVSRQPVTDQPVAVSLFSKNSSAALVPAQVVIPALTGSATFYVAAVNDTNVTGPKSTLISAQAMDILGNLVGSPATEALTVQDNNGPALRVTIANKVVPKGASPATTAVVWTATPPTNRLVVTLTSSQTNEATVPASVTIRVGQTNALFVINSLNDGISNSSQTLSITASATNYASGSDVLTVTDSGLPDLVISQINAPGAVFTEEPLTIGFNVLNQGLGEMTNGVTQTVYFTTNPISGSYLLMGSAYLAGPLAPGQYAEQSVVVPGSSLPPPGIYWVIVTADANNNAVELNEGNNNAAAGAPLVVSPEYTATVHAGLAQVLLGTPVPLTGSATLAVGGPATNVPVDLLLTVRGLQRIIGVYTDTNGNFSTLFTPLPNEAGTYTVSAVSPGITAAPPQAQFNILGMSLTPASLSLSVASGASVSGSVSVQNLGDVPLTGLTASVNGQAANLTASATLSTNYVAGQGAVTLSYNVAATNASIEQSSFTVQIASVEGAVLSLPVSVSVMPPSPVLVASPAQLSAAMVPGGQTVVQFEVLNVGGAASGPMSVNVPSAPWLNVASMNPLPALAPGQSNMVTLLLTPPADLALGPYTGNLTVNSISANVQVPFTFNAVSDSYGSLRVQSVDEYTFYSAGAPPLTNASVTLTDPFTGSVVASGVTDSNGLFFVPSLLAGNYSLAVAANQHSSFSGSAVVTPGQTNTIQTFLSLQTVTYTWSVIPTQIQDDTQITIEATFQTDVPAPVVVPTPTSIDVSSLTQVGQFISVPLTLANYGLIAAQGVTLSVNSTPAYQFNIVTTNIGTIPAYGTVTIPMTITLVQAETNQALANDSSDPCTISLGIGYFYPCGIYDVSTAIRIPVLHVMGDCGGASYPGNVVVVGCNGCGGGGGTVIIPPSVGTTNTCDQCLAKAIIECAIGFTPLGNAYTIWKNIASELDPGPPEEQIEGAISDAVGSLGPIGNTASCLWSFLRCKCPQNLATNVGGFKDCVGNLFQQLGGGNAAQPNDSTVGLGLSAYDLKDVYAARSYSQLEFLATMVGDTDGRWFSPGSGGAFGAFFEGFAADIQSNNQTSALISPAQTTALLALPRPSTVAEADVQNAVDRWNLSLGNWRAGIWSPTNVAPGGNTNFIDLYYLTNVMTDIVGQYQASVAAGYDSPVGGFFAALNADESQLGSYNSGSTCASIVLQIDQTAILTLNAFHATLQLDNNGPEILTNISVDLVIQNQAGQDVTSLFGIQPPVLSGSLTGVDGSGMLAPSATGSAQWTLIPGLEAAPEVATNYLVSGSFSYVQNGITITLPLSPQPITVQPSPQLYLTYFLQRDVYGDDPFTPEIEPSIPFPLAVMVQNKGYGAANNFQIMSAQPKIVDNEKGLLINFDIIGAQVEGQPVTPSLTVNFGNVAPGAIDIGVWWLTCSLEGLFTGYSASYQNLDALGNPQLSPIQGVQIHELIHMVQADGAWNDGEPDFLVVEAGSSNSLPNALYLSDGTVQPVSVVQAATNSGPVTSSNLQVQFTANFPAGFSYVLVPDPAGGRFPLQNVSYANGTNFLTNNFWVTDRTFIGLGVPPLLQTNLNLFVYHTNAGPDTFTLVYEMITNAPQTNAPVSEVFSLPAQSPAMFGVVWTGESYAGQAPIAYYDIYVSDNGGPFTVWQSQTTATGALYTGVPGHTYAFYSIATDTAGNREATPLAPQATTTVVVNSSPPTISVASNVTLNAGQTLTLNVTASDPNPLNTLTFSLGAGAPAGVVVNPTSGQITWATSPTLGGTTNLITVIVTDNGQPPLSATGMVTVVLLQVVYPPVLAPIPNYTIYEATPLIFTNSATDTNVPPRPFTFSLGAGAPTNATMDKLTGVFQWTPTASQAPSTNLLSVIVTDDGNPPLSATQQFTVIVKPVAYEFLLSFGYTNLFVGGSNSVAVTLSSQLPLTNITAVLQASTNSLTNLTLTPVSPEVMGTLLQPLGASRYGISFNLNPALSPGTTRALAQLSFVSVPQVHSAIVPLVVSQPAALETGGLAASKPAAENGRVIIVGREPVLDTMLGSNFMFTLTIYGNIGSNYQTAFSTNIAATNWQAGASILITNQQQNINLSATNTLMYFRLQ